MLRETKLLFAVAAFVIVSVASASYSQSLPERHDQIRAAIDANSPGAAIDQLKSLRTADSQAFGLNNYDYLLGRLSQRKGDLRSAAANYQAVVARKSVLDQYALWHLSELARTAGDLVAEREQLRRLLATAPGNRLREAATMRLAQSSFESADYSAAASSARFLFDSKNQNLSRQAEALAAQAYVLAGQSKEAHELFTKLVMQMPDASRPDDFALAGARGLDQLDPTNTSRLSESDHLLRASVYQFNRDFGGARSHYEAIVRDYPQGATVPEALYQIGRGLFQEGEYDDALRYLRRVVDEHTASGSMRDALGLLAACDARLQRTDDAIAAYRQLIDRFPNAPNPERSYINIIDVLRDAGRDSEARDWIKQARARLNGQIGETLALFESAKLHLARGEWNLTLSDLEELQHAKDLGARINGGTTTSEVLFLRAFALEQLGRTDEAINAYLSLPEGRNEYYSFRADERLRTLGSASQSRSLVAARLDVLGSEAKHDLETNQSEAARRATQSALRLTNDPTRHKELIEIVRAAYTALPAYRFASPQLLPLGRQQVITAPASDQVQSAKYIADELFFLGLNDEAVPEFNEALGGGTSANTDLKYTLAVDSLRGGLPYPAIRFAEETWRSIPGDYVLELAPRQMVELLYPTPYNEALLKYATPKKLDPRFVLAIARQETRFQADAKSVAAARGLMQFISATADDTAKQLGLRDFHEDDLYNPEVSIQFGSQYLATLFKQFPDQPAAVAGAYNGGADSVARWIARSHANDPDRYLAEIGFAQSKDYIFRVMSNYWIYQQLYSDQLQRQ